MESHKSTPQYAPSLTSPEAAIVHPGLWTANLKALPGKTVVQLRVTLQGLLPEIFWSRENKLALFHPSVFYPWAGLLTHHSRTRKLDRPMSGYFHPQTILIAYSRFKACESLKHSTAFACLEWPWCRFCILLVFYYYKRRKKPIELFMSLQGHRDLPTVWPQLNTHVIVY